MSEAIVFTGDSTVSIHRAPDWLWEPMAAMFPVTRFGASQWLEAFGEPGTLVVFGPEGRPCDCCSRIVWVERDGRVTDREGPHTCANYCPVPGSSAALAIDYGDRLAIVTAAAGTDRRNHG